jgi:anti-sigma factor RsiW
MTEPTSRDDDALSALIDGVLPSDEAAALRARLEQAALAARLAAMERANRAVRDAYRDVVDEPLPERVLDLLRAPRPRRARRRPRGSPTPPRMPRGCASGRRRSRARDRAQARLRSRPARGQTPAAGLLASTGPVAPTSALRLLESAPSGGRASSMVRRPRRASRSARRAAIGAASSP